MNVIASYRPSGFLQHFYKFGIFPTLVTHRWEFDENKNWIIHNKEDEVLFEKDEIHQVIRIPRYHTVQGRVYRLLEKNYFTRQILILFNWLTGFIDPGVRNSDSYFAYKEFLYDHLKTNSYDMVMGIFSPHHHLKLCYEINRKFGIPYILDFRDLWDNMATDLSYKPKGIKKIYVWQVRKLWSKWLSNAKFFTTLSQPWVDKLSELTKTPGHIIMHGYDMDIEAIQNTLPSREEFIVLYVGSLYQNQDLEGFLSGVELFMTRVQVESFKLVFLGSDRTSRNLKGGFYHDISKTLLRFVPENNVCLLARLPRQGVLKWYKKSSILIHISYENEFGRLGGKFFEYVGTERPILVHSNGNCLISDNVKKYRLGYVAETKEQIAEFMNKEYEKWRIRKRSDLYENKSESKRYSREFQSYKLSQLLKK